MSSRHFLAMYWAVMLVGSHFYKGWAALTVLAVVIIAIALYYLGRQDPERD